MKYIGIGGSCVTAKRLRMAGFSTNESHFFDWIITRFKTVIEVLECDGPEELVKKLSTNLEFESEPFEGNHVLQCNNFELLKSLHDLPWSLNRDVCVKLFVERYTRRYLRLLEFIRNNTDICFIHWVSKNAATIDEHDVMTFHALIKKISPACKFKLVLLFESQPVSEQVANLTNLVDSFVICIDTTEYVLDHPEHGPGWTQCHLNWTNIFEYVTSQCMTLDYQ